MTAQIQTPVQLIVGLGNPGTEYDATRHNAGADFVEALAAQYGAQLTSDSKFKGRTARVHIQGKDVRLLIPTTFMNCSGQAVGALANFFKIPPAAILVAHDELDMPPGKARLKIGGGHGGHNGLKDIIRSLGNSKEFGRLRLGIGHPGNAKLVASFVLKKAPMAELDLTEQASRFALESVPLLANGHWSEAMQQLHPQANP